MEGRTGWPLLSAMHHRMILEETERTWALGESMRVLELRWIRIMARIGLPRGDINSDHLGIQKNGSVSHFGGNSIAGPIAAITGWNNNIENNTYHDLRVTYNATTNEMVVYFNCVQRLVGTVDLEDVLDASEGIWGFTAATGGASNIQRVKNMEWFAWPQGMAEDEVVACPGVPVELTVGSEAVSPTWSPAGGLSSTSGYSVDATVAAAATYTVSYDDICGVEQSESVDLVVVEFPSTELPVDTILCDEGTLTFSNGPWPEGISGMWEDGSSDLSREIITPGRIQFDAQFVGRMCFDGLHDGQCTVLARL